MPIYTYKCINCGKVFDFLFLKSSEEPKCPQCGSKNLEKQVTAPGSVRVGSSQSSGKPVVVELNSVIRLPALMTASVSVVKRCIN
ncbi:MAG: FmdB family zinc ribbon protein [Candidatus Aenigmatarchaeota archaeon]